MAVYLHNTALSSIRKTLLHRPNNCLVLHLIYREPSTYILYLDLIHSCMDMSLRPASRGGLIVPLVLTFTDQCSSVPVFGPHVCDRPIRHTYTCRYPTNLRQYLRGLSLFCSIVVLCRHAYRKRLG